MEGLAAPGEGLAAPVSGGHATNVAIEIVDALYDNPTASDYEKVLRLVAPHMTFPAVSGDARERALQPNERKSAGGEMIGGTGLSGRCALPNGSPPNQTANPTVAQNARELILKFCRERYDETGEYAITTDHQAVLIPLIAAALTAERAEAIEECAHLCDEANNERYAQAHNATASADNRSERRAASTLDARCREITLIASAIRALGGLNG